MKRRKNYNKTHGLINKTGENNCFINSVIQVIWHLDVFRERFVLSSHSCNPKKAEDKNECFICAMLGLFANLRYSLENSIPPSQVRDTLSHVFAKGEIHSAIECFEEFFHEMEKDSNLKALTDEMFETNTLEMRICGCRATSEPFLNNSKFFYVSAEALLAPTLPMKNSSRSVLFQFASLRKKMTNKKRFEKALKDFFSQAGGKLECPDLSRTEEEGQRLNLPACRYRTMNNLSILNSPKVFSLCLNWQSDQSNRESIRRLLQTVSLSLELKNIFQSEGAEIDWDDAVSVESSRSSVFDLGNKIMYRLKGVVVYYGKHYTCYVYHTGKRKWIYCDDEKVSIVGREGSWAEVVQNCIQGRKQVEILVYSREVESKGLKDIFVP